MKTKPTTETINGHCLPIENKNAQFRIELVNMMEEDAKTDRSAAK